MAQPVRTPEDTAPQGSRIMPIRTRPSVVDSPIVGRMVRWLRGRRPSNKEHRVPTPSTDTATATIGRGSGHAARRQVTRQGGRHVPNPGPGSASLPIRWRSAEDWVHAGPVANVWRSVDAVVGVRGVHTVFQVVYSVYSVVNVVGVERADTHQARIQERLLVRPVPQDRVEI